MLYLEKSGAFWSWSKHAGAVARPVALSVAASCYVVDRLGAQVAQARPSIQKII